MAFSAKLCRVHPVPSINSSALKYLSFSDTARPHEFFGPRQEKGYWPEGRQGPKKKGLELVYRKKFHMAPWLSLFEDGAYGDAP